MKKIQNPTRLRLARESLRPLQDAKLTTIVGGDLLPPSGKHAFCTNLCTKAMPE